MYLWFSLDSCRRSSLGNVVLTDQSFWRLCFHENFNSCDWLCSHFSPHNFRWDIFLSYSVNHISPFLLKQLWRITSSVFVSISCSRAPGPLQCQSHKVVSWGVCAISMQTLNRGDLFIISMEIWLVSPSVISLETCSPSRVSTSPEMVEHFVLPVRQ